MSYQTAPPKHHRETSRAAACPACGERRSRYMAKFCRTCGRSLAHTDYLPADNLRASYRARPTTAAQKTVVPQNMSAPQRAVALQKDSSPKDSSAKDLRSDLSSKKDRSHSLFADAERNVWASVALALTTYALVPYLGILFCPGAIVAGGLGLARARRLPHEAGRRAARLSIWLSFAICFAQLLLWLVLFSVPGWQR